LGSGGGKGGESIYTPVDKISSGVPGTREGVQVSISHELLHFYPGSRGQGVLMFSAPVIEGEDRLEMTAASREEGDDLGGDTR